MMMDDDGLIELEAFGLTGNFLSDVLPGVVQLHGILENWNQGHPNQRAMFMLQRHWTWKLAVGR